MLNPLTGLWHAPVAEPYRLLSIDPGTNKLGLSILSCDFYTGQIGLLYSITLDVELACRPYKIARDIYGHRFARLLATKNALKELMYNFDVHGVVTECPYMGRFPQAYAALTECLTSIRGAVMEYDNLLPLHEIDPATVKMHVNVSGKSGDKELVQKAVIELLRSSRIINYGSVDYSNLGPDAFDSMAVGYAHFRRLFQ